MMTTASAALPSCSEVCPSRGRSGGFYATFLALLLWPGAAAAQQPAQPPVLIEATYTADVWRNLRGGLRRGSAYLDNLDLVATVDADRTIGLANTTFVVSGLYNNRTTFSDRFVGDLKTVSNIDTDGSVRLYEAWAEHRFAGGAAKIGLIDLNSEFDVNETGALFINSSHGIGPDFSQVGENGPGIFPITALGARVSFALDDRIELRTGLFEGIAGDPERPRRTVLRLSGDEGYLAVTELHYRPRDTIHLALGVRHLKTRTPDPQDLGSERSTGLYALGEARVAQVGGRALNGFARIGFADGGLHRIVSYQGAGLALDGPLFGNDDHQEQLGIAVASAVTSRSLRAERADAGLSTDRRETTLELTYRAQLTPWLALQPDLQYVVNPGVDRSVRDALAAGMRIEVSWSSDR